MRATSLTIDLILNNTKAYIDKKIIDCSIAIDNGKIFKVGKETRMPKAQKSLNLKNLLVLPGLIDIHVHLRDEGKAYKEDFYSGTAAAATGGITSVLDMPNNEPVTMSAETLRNRMHIAERRALVNVGFYSEFPTNVEEIKNIVEEGAVAFKLFLADQIGGLNIDNDDAVLDAFKSVGRLKSLVAVHAEDKALLEKTKNELKKSGYNNLGAFLKAHSEEVELKAIKRVLRISRKACVKVHFCHVSTKSGLETIVDAKKSGMQITCEATPHHLFLSANDLRRIGTSALTMPPIREQKNPMALLKGIKNGWVDFLATDHAPHAIKEKKADVVWNVKVGIPNLETIVPLLLTAVNRGQLSITDIVRLMAEKPAETFKLESRGYLKTGGDADLTVVDLKAKYKIDASKFHSKAKYSPFDQWKVKGKPVKTFVNGRLIMDEGEIVAGAGSGRIIRRKHV